MKHLKIALGAILMVGLLAGSASAAQAATWKASPAGGTFSATGSGTTYLRFASGTTLQCTSRAATGKVIGTGGGTYTGPTYPGTFSAAASVTPTFSSCTAGGTPYTVTCAAASLNGTSTTATTAASGVTSGNLSGINCQVKLGSTLCRTVTGTVPGSYNNATKVLTVAGSGQSLSAAVNASCNIGSGAATFSSSATANADVTYTASGTGGFAAPSVWQS